MKLTYAIVLAMSAIWLALVVVGGVFTAVLRLRRAARGLRNPPVGKPCTN